MRPMSLERRPPFPSGRLFAFRQGINLNERWGPFAEAEPTATPRGQRFRRKASLVFPYLIMVITILRAGQAFAELANRAIAARPLGEASLAELDGGEINPNLGGYDPCEVEELAAFDMVGWIVQLYPGHENTYLRDEGAISTVSDFSLHDPTRRRFFRISGTSGFANEVFEYDENFVYIKREKMHSSPRDFYYHYAGYVWCPRVALVWWPGRVARATRL